MRRESSIVIILLIVISNSIPISSEITDNAEDTKVFFSLNFLSPASCCWNNPFGINLAEVLPEIGINISHFDIGSWGYILPRTFYYPVGEEGYYDYIPTYDEGGFDVLFIGWIWDLDWDPAGLFDSASIVPNGWNAYQYNNSKFDSILKEYRTEYDQDKRNALAKELQAILYEDLPAITFAYPRSLYVTRSSIIDIDAVLLADVSYRSEYWKNTENSKIVYATPFELEKVSIFADHYLPIYWLSAVYYGLFERQQGSHIYEPVIAKDVVVSSDKKELTVTLNPNAKFSNGEPVTAEDIKFTYQLYMSPLSNFHDYDYLVEHFENNDSIVTDGNDTIVFNLKEPYAFYPDLLSYGILNKKLVEAYIEDNGYDSLGDFNYSLVTSCGPFMVAEDNDLEGDTFILRKNPYWRNLTGVDPFLDEITFQTINSINMAIDALSNGSVTILDNYYGVSVSDFEDIYDSVNFLLAKITSTQEMMINLRHPIIGTGELTPKGTAEAAKALRKAISHASNRQKMLNESNIRNIRLGVPGVSPMPDACIGFDSSLTPYSYDLELAKKFIEEAGYRYEEPITATTFAFGIFLMNFLGLSIAILFYKGKRLF
ncbi:MAG: ABC transporter substrate-binding protein [Candidatus Heimdallarchaeaceae archaeon]